MAALPKLAPSRMTIEEFLDWPGDGSRKKFELVDGEPRAMAPASVSHGIIQANLAGILRSHLIGSRCCVVVESGIIPRARSDANMRVPDLAVSCEVSNLGQRALRSRLSSSKDCRRATNRRRTRTSGPTRQSPLLGRSC